VDIEMVTPRLKSISHKFLTEEEKTYLDQWRELSALYLQMLTIIWCAKEAIFKWHGEGNVDFRGNMILDGAIVFHADGNITVPFLFNKTEPVPLKVTARNFDNLILAYVVT
jgi:phosphopantetheinyl transferase (holo-ACP synthase)